MFYIMNFRSKSENSFIARKENNTKRNGILSAFILAGKRICKETTLAGYKHIVQPNKTLLERIAWSVILIIALITPLILEINAFLEFNEQPTIVITESTHYRIWNYLFPAVTICNLNQISKKKVYEAVSNFTLPNNTTTADVISDMRMLIELLKPSDNFIPVQKLENMQNILDENNVELETLLKNLAPSCADILSTCKWKNHELPCSHMFDFVKTSEGFCCSFNFHERRNATSLRKHNLPKTVRKLSGCGYKTALEVIVKNKPDDYFMTFFPAIGHQVIVHPLYDHPTTNINHLLIEMEALLAINISPRMTYATNAIHNTNIEQRNCLFSNERRLQYVPQYSYQNCMIECKANLTRELCGCIPWYIYTEKDDPKICNFRNIPCLTKNKNFILDYLSNNTEKNKCWCLPDCEYSTYEIEASMARSSSNISYQKKFETNLNTANTSIIKVFYTDLVAIQNRCDVLFAWQNLLAYYGGLLGLFTGFNFICLFELLYFFILKRLPDKWSCVKNNKRKIQKPLIVRDGNSKDGVEVYKIFKLQPSLQHRDEMYNTWFVN